MGGKWPQSIMIRTSVVSAVVEESQSDALFQTLLSRSIALRHHKVGFRCRGDLHLGVVNLAGDRSSTQTRDCEIPGTPPY